MAKYFQISWKSVIFVVCFSLFAECSKYLVKIKPFGVLSSQPWKYAPLPNTRCWASQAGVTEAPFPGSFARDGRWSSAVVLTQPRTTLLASYCPYLTWEST